MFELRQDKLAFSFPDVHADARLEIEFQRTLRIPDDGRTYPLPPGLGRFPLRQVGDCAGEVPRSWQQRGGVMLPIYQAEALWINFRPQWSLRHCTHYPFAVKISTGRINAVSGETWRKGLHRKPAQDYVVVPGQPWLDGYCVEKGVIRQFVAMPLGAGYTAGEQLTGKADQGGLRIEVFPMRRTAFEQRFPIRPADAFPGERDGYSSTPMRVREMGLAPGGRMKQGIAEDRFRLPDWDRTHSHRCWVHLANSMTWRSITGVNPPTVPPTAQEYNRRGLPWFEWYDEGSMREGSATLAGLKSVAELGALKQTVPLPENASVDPVNIKTIHAATYGSAVQYKEV